MASVKSSKIRKDVAGILKNGDLSQLSAKKIRRKLEEDYGVDLTERKQEIDDIVMELVAAKQKEDDVEEEEEEEEGPCDKGNNANGCSDSNKDSAGSESDFDEPEDIGPPVKKLKTAKKQKAASGSEDEEMDDAELAKQLQEAENSGRRSTRSGRATPRKKVSNKNDTGKRKGPAKGTSTYSQPCVLSPILSQIMGVPQMARSDVVKRMWEIIKERELADPKNKQFMICDEELQKLFGRKRVRTFGMMKYLKDHMWKPEDTDTLLV